MKKRIFLPYDKNYEYYENLNRIFPSFYFNIIENNFMKIPKKQKMEITNISILFLFILFYFIKLKIINKIKLIILFLLTLLL